MNKKLLIIAFALCVGNAFSQNVKVIDETNLQPIDNVYIYNETQLQTTLTNKKGEADISKFGSADILIFQHAAYRILHKTYAEIRKENFIIKLTESAINLDEIVVAASRRKQTKKEVPVKIVSIPAKEMKFYNPQTSADLLSASNQVYVQKSQMGGGSPMLRGFAANSVLLAVDGIRMNNAIYRSGNLQNVLSLDANSIENTEVIFGPGSVMYGSDALGGVMSFQTLQPTLATDEKLNFSVNVLTRYSSANNENTAHLDFNVGTKRLAFLTSFTYSDFDDLKMGNVGNDKYTRNEYVAKVDDRDTVLQNSSPNTQRYSGYNQLNLMQKVKFKLSKKTDVDYAFHYSKVSDVPRYDRLIQYKDNRLKYGDWYYGPQKWMMHSLTFNIIKHHLLFDHAKVIVAYQNYEESRHNRKFGKSLIGERTEHVAILSVNHDFDKELTKNGTLFYGFELADNIVESTAHERDINSGETSPLDTRYPDGGTDYASMAYYASYKHNLNKKTTLIAGARYSYIKLKSKFEDKTFFPFSFDEIILKTGALNGSLGLVYRPADKWQFNANLSSGFRAPNLDDIAKVFDSEPGTVVVPNKDLKSEYAYNLDLGVIKRFNDNFKLEISAFYTILQDAMVRRDFQFNGQDSILYDGEMSKVKAIVNADHATIYGGSISFYTDITNHFQIKTNLTYADGEDSEGMPLRHVTPLFGSTHFIYKTQKLKTDFYVVYNGEINNENLAPSEQDKTYMYATDKNGNPYSPSWYTLNIKASYQFNEVLQVNAGIENILNHRYRSYSSGICAPGRNFIVSMRASF